MDDSLEIVSSFPHPPRQFYENLTVEEIKQQAPPEMKTELKLFGSITKLTIDDAQTIMLTEQTVSDLKRLKNELMSDFNDILSNIEQIENENGAAQITERITKPFQEIFAILKRLRTLESTCGLIESLKDDFAAVEAFLKAPI